MLRATRRDGTVVLRRRPRVFSSTPSSKSTSSASTQSVTTPSKSEPSLAGTSSGMLRRPDRLHHVGLRGDGLRGGLYSTIVHLPEMHLHLQGLCHGFLLRHVLRQPAQCRLRRLSRPRQCFPDSSGVWSLRDCIREGSWRGSLRERRGHSWVGLQLGSAYEQCNRPTCSSHQDGVRHTL